MSFLAEATFRGENVQSLLRSCVILFALTGCSRTYYRQSADAETYPIIAERILAPGYEIGRRQVEPEPISRLADSFSPDNPPKPPDDPAAGVFMANPGGLRGASNWEADGVTDQIENATWFANLNLNEDGEVVLDQDQSVELALRHSREYQTALENVYSTALSLTLNRFDFDMRWFNRRNLSYGRTGASSLPTESNTLARTGDIGYARNLAAGGQLLMDFANSFVWEFTGKSHSVTGNFGFTLIQPLLRGFGRDIRLESLTQAERETLYSVQNFARFRKSFWADIAISDGGYLDLLLQIQTIRNAKENLRAQEENYKRIQAFFEANKRSVVEVDTAFQQLLNARQQVLNSEISFQNSLDNFKLQLGLPPRIPVKLDEKPLEQFVLIDPAIEALRAELDQFEIARKGELDAIPSAEVLQKQFEQLLNYLDRSEKEFVSVQDDLKKWKTQIEGPQPKNYDEETIDREKQSYQQWEKVVSEVPKKIDTVRASLKKDQQLVLEKEPKISYDALMADLKTVISLLDEGISAQTLSRIYRIRVPEIGITEEEALVFAKDNRLDLQNQQAIVTDAWRQVRITANALKSDITVTAGGNLITEPNSRNPFNFSNDFSRMSVALQVDGPLNRQLERNNYRTSLINYQRARRLYMQQSDQIEQQIRRDLRSLRQLSVSFEIARQQLIAAARQVENERILQNAPVAQQQGGGGDPTLRTLQALASLNGARNALASSFISFQQQRIQLLLDLEFLQLDLQGYPTNEQFQFERASDTPTGDNGSELIPSAPQPAPATPPGE